MTLITRWKPKDNNKSDDVARPITGEAAERLARQTAAMVNRMMRVSESICRDSIKSYWFGDDGMLFLLCGIVQRMEKRT